MTERATMQAERMKVVPDGSAKVAIEVA